MIGIYHFKKDQDCVKLIENKGNIRGNKMKKIIVSSISVILILLVLFGVYKFGRNTSTKETRTKQKSSKVVSSSIPKSKLSSENSSVQDSNNEENNQNYDPNRTLSGQNVDATMIKNVTAQLRDAGLPVDYWAPSDIKTIITQASQQGVSVVDYAKQNFHQYG
ncbi:hypothetical protein G6R29_04425 [Fructobacillus sp. M2-14]|uniref:Uncharacterized protein n=1 Tax=Fructobacillus broussonetiae TaxID=2713173 RepID=A0ABS5R096_9LACO|nr:hypothetical protein [Fructobacillus broussonetiae]